MRCHSKSAPCLGTGADNRCFWYYSGQNPAWSVRAGPWPRLSLVRSVPHLEATFHRPDPRAAPAVQPQPTDRYRAL
jgi:hypothetical protein